MDSFAGTNGTNIISHTANTGQSWSLNGGFTNKIQIQTNTAQLASGADNNNWRMAITTDAVDDTFDIWADYTRGSQNVVGDYAHLEFLAKSGSNPPTDRVYVSLSRQSATTVMVRLVRTFNFSNAQSVVLDTAFPLDTAATKRFGATIAGLGVQVWWEPAGGGTRTNIGSPVTLTADYRDGLHKRVAFNLMGAQAFSAGSPRIDNFTVATPAPPDTGWQLLVDRMPTLDATRVVDLGGSFEVYRTDISLSFKPAVTDDAKHTFFANHSMSSIQVTQAGRFFVRIPDPGTASALLQTITSLRGDPEIALASWVPRSQLLQVLSYRYPIDGPGQERANWVPTSANTWAMRAIRAPLAWGCETGAYDTSPVRLGVFEWKHQSGHPEFAGSLFRLWEPSDVDLAPHVQPSPPATVQADEAHASATVGLAAAEGNNGSGIAGVTWRSSLYLYAGDSPGNRALPFTQASYMLMNQLIADAPRVLSFSADQVFPVNSNITPSDREAQIRWIADDFRRVLDQTPGLLIVVAAGNERYRGTVANYLQDPAAAIVRAALLILRQEASYTDHILVVAGTYTGNNFWDISPYNQNEGSNFFTDAMDIAAPAQDVTVLAHWTGQTGSAVPTIMGSGTSLSAPLVAGVAGLLLSVDPSLTTAQVKGYIVLGAQRPRADEQTGQVAAPLAVAGAPATIFSLDAYGALTLMAAERQHIPLCGNRVWVQNNQVIAERELASPNTETLFNLTEPRSYVNVRHGGRRIEVSDDTSDIALQFQLDHWTLTQDVATTADGGAHLSMEAWSHDLDTLARDQYWTSATHDTAFFEHRLRTFNPFNERVLDTLSIPLAQFTGWECVSLTDGECSGSAAVAGSEERVIEKFAYAPVGNRLFVAVNYLVTRWVSFGGWGDCTALGDTMPTTCRSSSYQEVSERSDVWTVNLTTGVRTFLWTVPRQVYWLGVSEDGGQIASGEGVLTTAWTFQWNPSLMQMEEVSSNPGTITGCSIHYRMIATGVEMRPQVLTTDGCTIPTRGNGTVAPVPLLR
ncbi:MAG TPA: S8 family serine peptidase [Gemmatimonadales bacterium]|nr:S8 family serine peptidase [Gemmatimonadales bacterium]